MSLNLLNDLEKFIKIKHNPQIYEKEVTDSVLI